MRNCLKIAAAITLLLIASGCAHYEVNPPLATYDPSSGYRFKNIHPGDNNTDSLFMVLAFSGGGTRAAALSYGVLEYLRATRLPAERKDGTLLDEVDVISSVSGGSFTAAYYGLFREKIFTEFEWKFLKADIQGALAWRAVYPPNWFRLASPAFGRIDMAAEYYDEKEIFDHATFGQLVNQGRRPFILINATDMTLGARFEFTQNQFDLICSDLSGFPISRAVAASSAFPVLLNPLTLRNYAGQCDFKEPSWVGRAMKDMFEAPLRYHIASEMRSYTDVSDRGRRDYIHLLDGGIADNVGLRGPQGAVLSLDSGWGTMGKINSVNSDDKNSIKKLAFIVVNAKTDPETSLDRKERSPGLVQVLETTSTKPMENYTFDTVLLLEETLKQLRKDASLAQSCKEAVGKKCPGVEVAFPAMPDPDLYSVVIGFDALKDEKERRYFSNLPTNFSLPADTVDCLRQIAGKLLTESHSFQALLQSLGASRPSPAYRQEVIDACVARGDGDR